jgi:hypothetical protein
MVISSIPFATLKNDCIQYFHLLNMERAGESIPSLPESREIDEDTVDTRRRLTFVVLQANREAPQGFRFRARTAGCREFERLRIVKIMSVIY